jgi:hypothetical protein
MNRHPIKRLILFGAGASHGSVAVSPKPPPLAAGLYAELARDFPRWANIHPELKSAFESDFEDGMGRLWASGDGHPERTSGIAGFMHDMARHFARFSATDGNVYVRLIEAVERAGKFDGTVFASLNYECILEQSLERCSKLVRYFEEAASAGNAAACWKLHGSCNFVPEQEVRITGIAMPRDAPLGLKITAIDYRAVEGHCDGQQGHLSAFDSPLAPTMSVFMRGKPVLFSPPEIRRLQSWWANAVLRAEVWA